MDHSSNQFETLIRDECVESMAAQAQSIESLFVRRELLRAACQILEAEIFPNQCSQLSKKLLRSPGTHEQR